MAHGHQEGDCVVRYMSLALSRIPASFSLWITGQPGGIPSGPRVRPLLVCFSFSLLYKNWDLILNICIVKVYV